MCRRCTEGWRSVLEPVIARYRERGLPLWFRGDAAFAKPELYELLEAEGIGYAIRMPANTVLQERIGHLLTRLQLHALAYNLANFLRSLALPQEVEQWSLTTLREKLVTAPGSCATGATSSSSSPRSPCRGCCSPRSCAGSIGCGRAHHQPRRRGASMIERELPTAACRWGASVMTRLYASEAAGRRPPRLAHEAE